VIEVGGAIADPGKLAQVVVYSLIAGVGVSAVFAIAVSGAAGLLDALRDRRRAAAAGWAAVATLGIAIAVAAIIIGVVVMTTK
jgi:MFS family permease